MKAKISYWKNWDSSFGAKIILSVDSSLKDEFPTSCIFKNDKVDFDNRSSQIYSISSVAEIDYTSQFNVAEFIENTLSAVSKLLSNYYSAVVPSPYVVDFEPETYKS